MLLMIDQFDVAMPSNDVLLCCLIGVLAIALGALLAWLLARPGVREAYESGRASRDVELTQLLTEREAAVEAHKVLQQDHAACARELDVQRRQVMLLGSERATLAARLERLPKMEADLSELRTEHQKLGELRHRAEQRIAQLETQLREQMGAMQDKLGLLEKVREEFTDKFKALAGDVLEEESRKFTEQNASNLGALLTPLREQIGDFRKLVSESYEKESHARVSLQTELKSELKQLFELNHRLSDEAHNLTRALKNDSRSQGAWGEMILERLLEMAGLQAGRQYVTQGSFVADDGSRQRPDVIVHLPEGKDIVVDAKVSLVGWDRYTAAANDEERALGLRDLQQSIRRHIDGLSGKDYSSLPDLRTLDFVLLFIPIESAFAEALRADDKLYEYALGKKISLVSPSTLLIALQTVGHLWKMAERNVNALEFAKIAGQLHDNFAVLIEGIQNVGSKLESARSAHDDLLWRLTKGGNGSVLLQIQKLQKLKAQTRKTLPRGLLDSAGASDEAETIPGTDGDLAEVESLPLREDLNRVSTDGESPGA
jgi:DNA recombination protein RmuC